MDHSAVALDVVAFERAISIMDRDAATAAVIRFADAVYSQLAHGGSMSLLWLSGLVVFYSMQVSQEGVPTVEAIIDCTQSPVGILVARAQERLTAGNLEHTQALALLGIKLFVSLTSGYENKDFSPEEIQNLHDLMILQKAGITQTHVAGAKF